MDMLIRLYALPAGESAPGGLKDRGVLIRRPMAHEKHKVLAWIRGRFGEGWASECDVAFSVRPFGCHVAVDRGRILGFSCHEATRPGFIGPMGVDKSFRRRGIGRALLLASAHAMEARGYAYAVVGGVGPAEFYERTAGATRIDGSSPGGYAEEVNGGDAKEEASG